MNFQTEIRYSLFLNNPLLLPVRRKISSLSNSWLGGFHFYCIPTLPRFCVISWPNTSILAFLCLSFLSFGISFSSPLYELFTYLALLMLPITWNLCFAGVFFFFHILHRNSPTGSSNQKCLDETNPIKSVTIPLSHRVWMSSGRLQQGQKYVLLNRQCLRDLERTKD